MSQSFMAPVNSSRQPLPLWKRQIALSDRWRWAQASSWARGATARAVTRSARTGVASSIRDVNIRTVELTPILRAASARKADLRASASMRVIRRSGRSAATTRPGKPPPLPRSTRLPASRGRWVTSCAESRTWRCHTSRRPPAATRLMAFCQRTRVATSVSRRSSVSRETFTPRLAMADAKPAASRMAVAIHAARRTNLSRATKAAGVTPEIREAWPRVVGRWA